MTNETSSGALVSNEVLFHMLNNDLPFGGVGLSGYGRYHGYEGFKAFSNPKSMLVKNELNVFPFDQIYPPFTRSRQKMINKLQNLSALDKHQYLKRIAQLPFTFGKL